MITETSPILSLLFAKGLGPKTLSALLDRMIREDMAVDDIVNAPPERLVERFGLRPDVAGAIRDAHDRASVVAEELEQHGVQVLIRGIEPYPSHLGRVLGVGAPPILFVRGDLSILATKAVGFCGARRASEKGIRVAAESAKLLASDGVNVVSGYAKGVDLAAHRAAMHVGGVTTIVLAEGILHFRPKGEVKALLDDHNHLVVSEFSPRLPWSGRNAMQRNRTIIGLSDAVICIESGMRGGTFAAADTTLSLNLPLFVADYAQPAESAAGNRHFLQRGAIPLRGNRDGQPNLERVYAAIGMAPSPESSRPVVDDSTVRAPADAARDDERLPADAPIHSGDSQDRYPKRLIEVDLPIARISAHARREKSIRHGHISTLHVWWARRPLAACRAVICAALWPDPAGELCPPAFREAAVETIKRFAARLYPKKITKESKLLQEHGSAESLARWEAIAAGTLALDAGAQADMPILRLCLLDFIADFANWDNSTAPAYLEASRALTQAAHEALGGAPGSRPLVVDPFAGGGSIPLEALRVGADAFASDLNPVPVLLNKVVLEYIPKYGQRLADEVRKWGRWVKEQAEKELAAFYPQDADGATPIAYLWARTILSEAPGQGDVPVEVPLMRSLWLAKKASRRRALRWVRDAKGQVKTETVEVAYVEDGQPVVRRVRRPLLEIFEPKRESEVEGGTVARGSATCPVTGYTMKVDRVRAQLKSRRGGAADARLFCVVSTRAGEPGRFYRLPTQADQAVFAAAAVELERREKEDGTSRTRKGRRESEGIEPDQGSRRSLVSDEPLDMRGIRHTWAMIYGLERWGDLFSPRQALALTTLARLVREAGEQMASSEDGGLAEAVQTCLALAIGRQADAGSSLCRWHLTGEKHAATFGRQALGMVWDFSEVVTLSEMTGGFSGALAWVEKVLSANSLASMASGHIEPASATAHPLPDDAPAAFITDPPYYDAVPYAYLSDFFYVWMRRTLADVHPTLFREAGVPKDAEIVVDRPHQLSRSTKDIVFYERELTKAFAEGRRITQPGGVGMIVFASKTTTSWEAILQAVVDAHWVITGSWPIDTEREARIAAQGQARLASSVHLVCRPRQNPDGSLREEVGEWRDVLTALPERIHEWMPRLASEGVVGADAIFACLGPALEIFSRYSRVEKASGEAVPLREYLEQVWAAVSTEAMAMIFQDADAAGLEPDARLTAMWLWTLGAGTGKSAGNGTAKTVIPGMASDEDEPEEPEEKAGASAGFTLEFDAARKIAQGLGVHLEKSASLVEVKGDKARLLPVAERTQYLFGKDAVGGPKAEKGRKKRQHQYSLFDALEAVEADSGAASLASGGPSPGSTVLDRVHQAMILFGAGRGEAMKRFLVEDGVGTDARFWRLAQSLSALYPKSSDEKRWVDGVLTRKKGLGL